MLHRPDELAMMDYILPAVIRIWSLSRRRSMEAEGGQFEPAGRADVLRLLRQNGQGKTMTISFILHIICIWEEHDFCSALSSGRPEMDQGPWTRLRKRTAYRMKTVKQRLSKGAPYRSGKQREKRRKKNRRQDEKK